MKGDSVKVVNLDDKADKKRYGVNSLLKDVKEVHDEEGIEMLAVVYKKKNNVFGYGTTYGNNAEFIGLLELGKIHLFEDTFE